MPAVDLGDGSQLGWRRAPQVRSSVPDREPIGPQAPAPIAEALPGELLEFLDGGEIWRSDPLKLGIDLAEVVSSKVVVAVILPLRRPRQSEP